MTGAIFKIFIVSNALGYLLVDGYPLGAPTEACDNNLLPEHDENITSDLYIPYSINASSIPSNGYIPGQTYRIILQKNGFGPYFKGFMIQGRVESTNMPTGAFIVGTNYQSLCIGNSAATHTNGDNKTSVILSWTAPPASTGSIYFRYTFVEQFSDFFANQTHIINEDISILRPPTDNSPSDDIKCRNDSDCSDHDETIVIAKCNRITGLCNCSLPSCHNYNNITNKCELKRCHEIVLVGNGYAISCLNKGSKSKGTALFLNIISFTGATNFYLGNYGLAIGQLLLFNIMIFTCFVRVCSCCVLCGVFCSDKGAWEVYSSEDKEYQHASTAGQNKSKAAGSAYSVAEVLLILLSLAELIWMIHDFIKIGLNGKLDGDGCLLGDDTVALIQNIAINTLEVGS